MVACFIGHRKTSIDNSFILRLENCLKELITCDNVDTFLFGSRSEFDDICLQTVTELKKIYAHIKRVYVRVSYSYIDESYEKHLLNFYDETHIPDRVIYAGKAAYVQRNEYMINKADICIFYYNESYLPPLKPATEKRIFSYKPKSGTKLAYNYAVQKKKAVINLYSIP